MKEHTIANRDACSLSSRKVMDTLDIYKLEFSYKRTLWKTLIKTKSSVHFSLESVQESLRGCSSRTPLCEISFWFPFRIET